MIVLFDVGNVIIKADHNITQKKLQTYGVSRGKSIKFFKNEEYKEFSRGKISGKEFFQILVKKYLQAKLTYQQIVKAHNAHMYGVDNTVLNIIQKLDKHKLVFVTDTNEWQNQRECELIDLVNFSDKIFRSNEIHMIKSDKGFFPYILLHLNVRASEVLLIDDNHENTRNAKNHGLRTLRFESAKQLVNLL